jgi:hypothetical protein
VWEQVSHTSWDLLLALALCEYAASVWRARVGRVARPALPMLGPATATGPTTAPTATATAASSDASARADDGVLRRAPTASAERRLQWHGAVLGDASGRRHDPDGVLQLVLLMMRRREAGCDRLGGTNRSPTVGPCCRRTQCQYGC